MRPGLVAAGILAIVLACAPAASADPFTRFASQAGGGAAPCTNSNNPCLLSTALAVAQPNDTVQLAAGTYTNPVVPITAGLDIVGAPGGAKPLVDLTGPTNLSLPGANQKLRNLDVHAASGFVSMAGANTTVSGVNVTGTGQCISVAGTGTTIENSKLTTSGTITGPCLSIPFLIAGGATIRNVEVLSTATVTPPLPNPIVLMLGSGISVDGLVVNNPVGPALTMQNFAIPGNPANALRHARLTGQGVAAFPIPVVGVTGDTVMSDSLVRAGGPSSSTFPLIALQTDGARMRNVTAAATGPFSQGLKVGGAVPSPTAALTSAKNSVFRGDANDVVIAPPTSGLCVPVCFPGGDLTVSHSNFRTVSGTLNGASADNQNSDPQFTDAAAGDFHPAAGSPLIDAGVDDADNSTTDLDGNPRKQGEAVDIGAFESAPPPPPQQQPVTPTGSTEPQTTTPRDTTLPSLTALGITNRTFTVGPAPTPVSLARAKKGTTFVYTLSEPARVTITIQRATPGRKKGRSCVKPTRKLRKAKKCTRFVDAGALQRSGQAGANAVPFSGRIGSKALKPGTYRAQLVATDAAGNKSTAKSIGFKVVKK